MANAHPRFWAIEASYEPNAPRITARNINEFLPVRAINRNHGAQETRTRPTVALRNFTSQPLLAFVGPFFYRLDLPRPFGFLVLPIRALYRRDGVPVMLDVGLEDFDLSTRPEQVLDVDAELEDYMDDAILYQILFVLREMIRKTCVVIARRRRRVSVAFTLSFLLNGLDIDDRFLSLPTSVTIREDIDLDEEFWDDTLVFELWNSMLARIAEGDAHLDSDKAISLVTDIQLLALRTLDTQFTGEENARSRGGRVKHPLRFIRGGCMRDFLKETYRKIFKKYVDWTEPIDLQPNLARWNCGIRCLLLVKFPESFQKREALVELCETAIEVRKMIPEIARDGPLSVLEMDIVARRLDMKFVIAVWRDGHGFELGEFGSPDADQVAFLLHFDRHFMLCEGEGALHELASNFAFCAHCSRPKSIEHIEKHQFNKKKRKRNDVSTHEYRLLAPFGHSKEKSVTKLDKIIVCDFETWRVEKNGKFFHEVYASALQVGLDKPYDEMQVFYGKDSLEQTCRLLEETAYTTTDDEPYVLYFYNGSGFDNLFLVDAFIQHCKAAPDSITVKSGRILAASFFNGTLVLRDLFLMTTCSLKEACKGYGVDTDKSKSDFDHEKMRTEEDLFIHQEECVEYLKLDIISTCEVLKKFRQAVFDLNDGMNMDMCKRITISQLSFDSWLTTVPESNLRKITLPKNSIDDDIIRQAFRGGRVFPQVKCWQSSQGWDTPYKSLKDYLVDLDVASLYPASMRGSKMLSGENHMNVPPYYTGRYEILLNFEKDARLRELSKDILEYQWRVRRLFYPEGERDYEKLLETYGINLEKAYSGGKDTLFYGLKRMRQGAQVRVNISPPSDLNTPLVPFSDEKGNIKWSLEPQVDAWFVVEELLESILHGYIVTEVTGCVIFETRIRLFEKHIDDNFKEKNLRERGDPRRDIAKLKMNTTYGKFGQKAVRSIMKIILSGQLEQLLQEEDLNILDLMPIINEETLAREGPRPTVYLQDIMELADRDTLLEMKGVNMEAQEVLAFKISLEAPSTAPTRPVYIASQVTAHSRMIMNRYLFVMALLYTIAVMFKYTDTDSLVVHASDYERAYNMNKAWFGKDLGQLDDELEGGRIVYFAALCPKFYIIIFKKSNEKLYMKIRTKGFPHPKGHICFDDLEKLKLEDEALWERIIVTADEDMLDPQVAKNLTKKDVRRRIPRGTQYINPNAQIPLGKYVYTAIWKDKKRTFSTHLNRDHFEGLLDGSMLELRVTFSSMKRRFCNEGGVGIAGMEHLHVTRSLQGVSWWSGEDATRGPPTKTLFDETYPKGHYAWKNE